MGRTESPPWLTRAPRTLYPHSSGTELMILPQTYDVVLVLMVLSLICLGSWVSMFKLAGKWRFELFYFDFAIGLALAALIYAFTVGNLGFDGFNFLDDLQHAGPLANLDDVGAGVRQEFLQSHHSSAEYGVRNGSDGKVLHATVMRPFNSALRTPHSAFAYGSFLVLRRPVMRLPSFHSPRFLSISTRSKRLSTFLLPPKVAAARRLRCCDIT